MLSRWDHQTWGTHLRFGRSLTSSRHDITWHVKEGRRFPSWNTSLGESTNRNSKSTREKHLVPVYECLLNARSFISEAMLPWNGWMNAPRPCLASSKSGRFRKLRSRAFRSLFFLALPFPFFPFSLPLLCFFYSSWYDRQGQSLRLRCSSAIWCDSQTTCQTRKFKLRDFFGFERFEKTGETFLLFDLWWIILSGII